MGFVVHCDLFLVGLGCVLMKHGNVVAYASRKHTIHENNYPTHDQGLTTMLFAFKYGGII